MAILDNVDNDLYPLFESESISGGTKDTCCNKCSCDQDIDFIQDVIDFEQ